MWRYVIGTSYPKIATNFKTFYLAEIFALLLWTFLWWLLLPCLRFSQIFIIFCRVVFEKDKRSLWTMKTNLEFDLRSGQKNYSMLSKNTSNDKMVWNLMEYNNNKYLLTTFDGAISDLSFLAAVSLLLLTFTILICIDYWVTISSKLIPKILIFFLF